MKKFLSIILAIAMLSSIMSTTIAINVSAEGVSTWDGVSASTTLSGTGSEADPYLIQSASDLKLFADMVNGGSAYNSEGVDTFAGKYVKQTVDVDLGGHPWTPIGYMGNATFQGVYDGDGHKINGLAISGIPNDRNGLFGAIGEPSVKDGQIAPDALRFDCGVANLTLSGTVALSSDEPLEAGVGGLVAYINNSGYKGSAKAYVTNVTVDVDLAVSGLNSYVSCGGLASEAYSTVFENVVNEGSVSVTADKYIENATGGLVGRVSNCEFTSCINNGDVFYNTDLYEGSKASRVGGLVGFYYKNGADQYVTFTACVNNGNVIAQSSNSFPAFTHCGGILGSIYTDQEKVSYGTTGSMWHDFNLTFKNCSNVGAVRIRFTQVTNTESTQGTAGGILGSGYSGNGLAHWNGGGFYFENCVNTGPVDFLNYRNAAGIAGNVYTDWYNTYDIEFVRCITAAREGDFAIVWGSAIVNFHSGTATSIHKVCSQSQKDAMLHMNDTARKCRDFVTADANALVEWNRSLLSPSITNINGMPTGAEVAVLKGVKNDVAELPYAVPPTMVVVDSNGNTVTNITSAGVYTVKLALVSVTPHVADEFSLAYNIAFERDFLSASAVLNFVLGENSYSASGRYLYSDFHSISTYGSLEAYSVKYTFTHILPQQLARSVNLTVTDGGKTVLSHSYSLAVYAKNQLNKTADQLGMSAEKKAAFDTFLVDMIKYGAAAQLFDGETVGIATSVLSEDQLSLASVFSADGLENVKNVTNDVDNEIIKWTAATLVFDQAITIRFKFQCDYINAIQRYKFSVGISDVSTTNYMASDIIVDAGSYYYIDVKGFEPTMYGNEIYVKLVNGSGHMSETITYSINSYIANMYTDATYGELVRALACYSASAQKFLSIDG